MSNKIFEAMESKTKINFLKIALKSFKEHCPVGYPYSRIKTNEDNCLTITFAYAPNKKCSLEFVFNHEKMSAFDVNRWQKRSLFDRIVKETAIKHIEKMLKEEIEKVKGNKYESVLHIL